MSTVAANSSGDNGQPCLMPERTMNESWVEPLKRREHLTWSYKALITLIAPSGSPKWSNDCSRNSWEMLGKAALKSNGTSPPYSFFQLTVMVFSSMSWTFISIERPFKKPRCILLIQSFISGSQANRHALAMILLSVLTIANGRVSPGP